jgi:hypothetical protein
MDQRLAMPVTTGLGLTPDEFSFDRNCSANFSTKAAPDHQPPSPTRTRASLPLSSSTATAY